MNTSTVATDNKRKFQKRYHYGKDTPCRLVKIPIQLMPQIEVLLKPWERADYEPLNEDMFDQRKRTSVQTTIKEIVAKELDRLMSNPVPTNTPVVINQSVIPQEIHEEIATLKNEVEKVTAIVASPANTPTTDDLESLKSEVAKVAAVVATFSEELASLKSDVESLKASQLSGARESQTIATPAKATESVATPLDKPTESKPSAKAVALELHGIGLKPSQIAIELERQGILSSVGTRIDSGVIARWIRNAAKGN